MQFLAAFSWISAYQYAALFFLTIIEGPIVMTTGGFLVKMGYLSFWPAYIVLMAGDLTADIVWYAIGANWGMNFVRKFGKFFNIQGALVEKMRRAFQRHHSKILITSKLTTGFGFAPAVLLAAGLSRVPFKKYITINAVGQFAWTALLMSAGYLFGNLYLTINEGLRFFGFVAFIVILFFAVRGVNHYLRSRKLIEKL